MNDSDEILFGRRGAAGIVTLNRPKALNALTHAMVVAMKARLDAWATDHTVSCVVVRGAGERAFCAGGDIRRVHDSGRAGTSYALDFWHDEYVLNAAIKHYPKPYVALIHGICMGGGIGVSVHGTYRVADPSALFAMPETGIGFFPDVGGSYFLPRCPGEIGMYLALTGARLGPIDAQYAGLVTDFMAADETEAVIAALAEGESPGNLMSEITGGHVVRRRHDAPPPLAEHREAIDRLFAAPSVDAVLDGLDREGSEWARDTAATMRSRSPTSLKLVFAEIRAGRTLAFDDCMRMEYRMANRILLGRDFYEGVRAAIIDKDCAPRWRPAALAEVADADIAAYFAAPGGKELAL